MKHKSLDSLLLENFAKNLTNIWEDSMLEFVQGGNGPGDGMDFIRALANAWFNQDLSAIADQVKQDTNPKKKNMMDRVIDAQQAVEKILGRGVHCPDGKVRKYYIDYNSEFSGVEVQSHDHYEHTDYDDACNEIDSRTGKPWSPYDLIKFDDDDLYEDWNKVNHHDKTNGLSQKAVNAYRREHPGSKLKTAVTTKPSKLKPGSKAAKRRKSFCARMSGNKGPMKKPNGKPTPKALALRRWNCESIEEMAQMILEGEQMIAEIKKGQKDSNGFTKCWPGKHAEGTKKGKNGGQVRNCVPNESMSETTGDKPFDTMMKTIKKGTGKQATADRKEQKQRNQEQTRQAIDNMFGGGNPADKLSIRKKGVAEGAQQAAIAIAKRESGKYTKDGKRKK